MSVDVRHKCSKAHTSGNTRLMVCLWPETEVEVEKTKEDEGKETRNREAGKDEQVKVSDKMQ